MLEWQPGNWYLAVHCRHCGAEFPFQRDGETSEATYFTDSNQIVLTCPECSYPLPYEAEEIGRSLYERQHIKRDFVCQLCANTAGQ